MEIENRHPYLLKDSEAFHIIPDKKTEEKPLTYKMQLGLLHTPWQVEGKAEGILLYEEEKAKRLCLLTVTALVTGNPAPACNRLSLLTGAPTNIDGRKRLAREAFKAESYRLNYPLSNYTLPMSMEEPGPMERDLKKTVSHQAYIGECRSHSLSAIF